MKTSVILLSVAVLFMLVVALTRSKRDPIVITETAIDTSALVSKTRTNGPSESEPQTRTEVGRSSEVLSKPDVLTLSENSSMQMVLGEISVGATHRVAITAVGARIDNAIAEIAKVLTNSSVELQTFSGKTYKIIDQKSFSFSVSYFADRRSIREATKKRVSNRKTEYSLKYSAPEILDYYIEGADEEAVLFWPNGRPKRFFKKSAENGDYQIDWDESGKIVREVTFPSE